VDQLSGRIHVEDIERALSQVAEVEAARVVTAADGNIAEIHIVALPSKTPKQLARDVESMIMARFGVPIDHRTISIAQLDVDSLSSSGHEFQPGHAPRSRILSINATVTGVQAAASVVLEVEGRAFTGRASGVASSTGRTRQIALATLDAVAQYAQEGTNFALEDVSVIQLGRERVAVACVTLVTPHTEQSLSGSALVRHSEKDSIVRAILDAVNRRIGLLTSE
jgi:hypothetical protein